MTRDAAIVTRDGHRDAAGDAVTRRPMSRTEARQRSAGRSSPAPGRAWRGPGRARAARGTFHQRFERACTAAAHRPAWSLSASALAALPARSSAAHRVYCPLQRPCAGKGRRAPFSKRRAMQLRPIAAACSSPAPAGLPLGHRVELRTSAAIGCRSAGQRPRPDQAQCASTG